MGSSSVETPKMSTSTGSIAVLVLLVAVVVAAPAAALVGPGQSGGPSAENAVPSNEADGTVAPNQTANGSMAPGAQFAGVVGVQKAEIEGELESRGFGIALAKAKTNERKARILANRTQRIRDRIQTLGQQQEALRDALQNGSMSQHRYRAEIAEVATRSGTALRLANQTANASAELPAELRAANGINETAIERLRTHARNLTGPEVAAIARSIGGPGVGHGLGKMPPAHAKHNKSMAGPPGQGMAGNGGDGRAQGAENAPGAQNGSTAQSSSSDATERGSTVAGNETVRRPMNGLNS